MITKSRLQADSFHQQMQSMRQRSVQAGYGAVRELGGVVFRKLIVYAQEAFDTGRYLRGWQMASNKAGLGPTPLEPLRTSRWDAKNRHRLQMQADRWALERERWVNIVLSYERRKGFKPSWKSYKEAVRILDRVGDLEDHALAQLENINKSPAERAEGEGPAIFIAGRKSRAKLDKGRGSARSMFRISQVERAILTTFGGDGRIYRQGEAWVVFGVNKEPHARIVEKNKRILARALADARSVGFTRRSAKEYLKTVAAGLSVNAGGGGSVATLAEAA